MLFNHGFHGGYYAAFKEATSQNKLLEMFNDFRHVNVMERIRNFGFSFFVKKSEATHGRISERIARIDRARIKHVKVTRRNKPRGSFAKKGGRKLNNW